MRFGPFEAPAGAQEPTTVGVDAIPTDNTATSLAGIEDCVSISNGETFDVDVFVQEVASLLAWEMNFQYDPAILEVVDRDTRMLQAANDNSRVIDVSANVPDRDGVYLLAAADIADPPSPDSGSGVLARVTLRAVGAGISPASLAPIDSDEDGTPDVGPLLVDIDGEAIDDSDGDTFFDGSIHDAVIHVNSDCPREAASPSPPAGAPTSTPQASTPEPSSGPDRATPTVQTPTSAATPQASTSTRDGDSGFPWVIIVIGGAGGIGALLAAGYLALRVIRGRTEGSPQDPSGSGT